MARPSAPRATTQAVALQLSELVLKTARHDEMAAFYTHLLGHGPFYERTPDPDAPGLAKKSAREPIPGGTHCPGVRRTGRVHYGHTQVRQQATLVS